MQMKNSRNRPRIGITLDWEDEPSYSAASPWYALRTNYFQVISKHEALPIALPYEIDLVDNYLDLIDGLMVTGGDYDLSPEYYGEVIQQETRKIKSVRTEFEFKLLENALKRNMPVLAICAGEQLLNVFFKGTLYQDISISNPSAFEHEQKHLGIPMNKTSHKINLVPNSLIHNIVKLDSFEVNSSHHQAVKSCGEKVVASGIAPDGIIEAIEAPDFNFVLGVQWHPEFEASDADSKIIQAFIKAAKDYLNG